MFFFNFVTFRTHPGGFLQFTCTVKVLSGRFCGRWGVQVRLFGLTCTGRSRSTYLGEVLPVQVNCRKETLCKIL